MKVKGLRLDLTLIREQGEAEGCQIVALLLREVIRQDDQNMTVQYKASQRQGES